MVRRKGIPAGSPESLGYGAIVNGHRAEVFVNKVTWKVQRKHANKIR